MQPVNAFYPVWQLLLFKREKASRSVPAEQKLGNQSPLAPVLERMTVQRDDRINTHALNNTFTYEVEQVISRMTMRGRPGNGAQHRGQGR